MARGHLSPQALRLRHAMRLFLVVDGGVLAGTVAWGALEDPLVGLVLGLVGCGWLVADIGCWDLEAPALRLRRVLAGAFLAVATARLAFPPSDWTDFLGGPTPWMCAAYVAVDVPAIVLTTRALRAVARRPSPASGGSIPPEGPAEIWPPLLVNPPRHRSS